MTGSESQQGRPVLDTPNESERRQHNGTENTGAIFISYRRTDTEMSAGRLADLLSRHFGSDQVFLDAGGIHAGANFVDAIAERLSNCRVFLAVIGPSWLTVKQGFSRRLFLADDIVRLELVAALSRGIPVIPVLVEGATMPAAASLPKSVVALAKLQAVALSTSRFSQDTDAVLVPQVKASVDTSPLPTETAGVERSKIAALLDSEIGQTKRSVRSRRFVVASLVAVFGSLVAALAKKSLDGPLNPLRNRPQFGQVEPDASKFVVSHESELAFYQDLQDKKITPLKFPAPHGSAGKEPILTLQQVLGQNDTTSRASAPPADQTVFHAVGCTGSTVSPARMAAVADAMTQELRAAQRNDKPAFLFHLGDVIYGFGQMQYYYDQFYVPFRHYQAPIMAIPGNHYGIPLPGSGLPTLDSFLRNFCVDGFQRPLEAAGELLRTPQIQPGVFYTFEAPFVRILALYSNILENPGVIANDDIGYAQIEYLRRAFQRIKSENYKGALIIAHHHPAYTGGSKSGWSIDMREQIDNVCKEFDVWPHAVLSAHAHNYQRLTRTVASHQIPYVIAGCGGHGVRGWAARFACRHRWMKAWCWRTMTIGTMDTCP
jgi:TIR domain/Calcineurin-like phosphoesterase